MGRSIRRRHARTRKNWRKLSVRQAAKQAGIRGGGLKTLLAGALVLELALGARQVWQAQGMEFFVIRQEETCRVEVIRPREGSSAGADTAAGSGAESGTAAEAGSGAGNGADFSSRPGPGDGAGTWEVYGIRLDPKTLEIQIYHHLQEAGPVGENDQNGPK